MAGTRLLVEESVAATSSSFSQRRRRPRARRPARRVDHDLAAHPPRPSRPRRRFRRAGARANGTHRPRRQGGGDRRALVRADARRAALERLRDRAAGGVRARAHVPDLRTEEEAVALANSTGTGSLRRSTHRRRSGPSGSAGRSVGTVWVNCFLVRDLTAPFGGIGISGIGREGDYALDFLRPEDAPDPGGLDPVTVLDPGPSLDDVNLRTTSSRSSPHETFASSAARPGVVVRLAARPRLLVRDEARRRRRRLAGHEHSHPSTARTSRTSTRSSGARQSMLETDPPRTRACAGSSGRRSRRAPSRRTSSRSAS